MSLACKLLVLILFGVSEHIFHSTIIAHSSSIHFEPNFLSMLTFNNSHSLSPKLMELWNQMQLIKHANYHQKISFPIPNQFSVLWHYQLVIPCYNWMDSHGLAASPHVTLICITLI